VAKLKDLAPETVVVAAEFAAAATRADQLPAPALAEIAFAGRSNVGKSSLLNTLMQRRSLARTSSTPGCTRQLNVFRVKTKDGLELGFVDLPGYGYAKRWKSGRGDWGPMIEGYLRSRVTLRAVVLLVDARRGVEDDDRELLEFLRAPRQVEAPVPVETIVVATKIDKVRLADRKLLLEALRRASGIRAIGFSAETKDGRDELWSRLRAAALATGGEVR
jgi:GTP-binding protein